MLDDRWGYAIGGAAVTGFLLGGALGYALLQNSRATEAACAAAGGVQLGRERTCIRRDAVIEVAPEAVIRLEKK